MPVPLALTSLLLITTMAHAEKQKPNECLKCHEGIEDIGKSHSSVKCIDCHQGNPAEAEDKEKAHKDLYPNPGDLAVAEQTCGGCHQEIVTAMFKSLHATSAGIISGARYTWAAQKEKNALYSVREVFDDDGDFPEDRGAVEELESLPHFSESKQPVDDYLRNQCLRCHIWTEGAKRHGDYRGSGCTACHMIYADDGLSHSGDKTIPKDKPGHPVRHEITSKIPSFQCAHCHNRGGRTGVSYQGMMESDGYATPFKPDGSKQPKLHGKNYSHLQKDVHMQAGMHCVDCHTSNEVHGDGNIYSKKEQATEVRCTTCHGTVEKYSDLKTAFGNPMKNLEKRNDEVVLIAKLDGREHAVKQVRGMHDRGTLPHAMRISGHMKKLECYACHSQWAPQCYGCHTKMDMRVKGFDWVDGKENTTYKWQESRSYLRWESPALGINTKGKVSPFIPGCQVIFTQIGEDGKPVVTNKVFKTADGYSGIAHNPIQPHTVSRVPRPCESCHANRKALGLGTGSYVTRLNGVNIPFELERFVDEDGRQLQATSHVGARPFNRKEMQKINRANVCLSCHQETPGALWKEVKKKWGTAVDSKAHHQMLREILRGSLK
ncbi:MAG: multiheme c-type cytochrome [Planctomycetota bacterium]|nr:multiheme c-type cytochrome [Planctomycetota bacterium]